MLIGAWTIHLVLIAALKIFYDIMPGVSQETSWTLTNITYMFGSYIMFHYVRGVPFEFNGGAYDNLNMWEQIDDGAQYTPAKKFLLSVPIVLFLLSTHYTHYDLAYFTINFLAVLGVIIPKLPFVSLYLFVGSRSRAYIKIEPSNACRTVLRGSRGLGYSQQFESCPCSSLNTNTGKQISDGSDLSEISSWRLKDSSSSGMSEIDSNHRLCTGLGGA